jgi:hypothetical protein
MTLSTILMAVALICFVLAAFGVRTGKVSMVALGLAFWVLATLVGAVHIG